MNVACGHGETETHPNGTIRCGKCGKWASIDGIAALEAENAALRAALSVERIEPAIFKGIREARRNGQTKDEQVVARIVAALAALNVEESR